MNSSDKKTALAVINKRVKFIFISIPYTISRSIKQYSASIYSSSLDPNKKNFFLKLFSIYTNIPIKELLLWFNNY